jgi:hypothetical protein
MQLDMYLPRVVRSGAGKELSQDTWSRKAQNFGHPHYSLFQSESRVA